MKTQRTHTTTITHGGNGARAITTRTSASAKSTRSILSRSPLPTRSAHDDLMSGIASMPPLEQRPSRLPSRLQHAIDRVRWHICGVFGVKAIDVADAHVAEFLARTDDEYLFRVLPGVGLQTEDDLRAWGRGVSAQAARGTRSAAGK